MVKSAAPTPTRPTRLGRVLAERKAAIGSFDGLARDVQRSSGILVDRRKLKRLVENHRDVALQIRELEALDIYLTPFGEGLAAKPLFEASSILEALAHGPRVRFEVGSYPRPEVHRTDVSRWDILALGEVIRGMNAYGVRRPFEIDDVLYDEANAPEVAAAYDRMDEMEAPSLVCFGSPRACHTSEVALARMFGVEPFEPPRNLSEAVPFYFAWAPGAWKGRSRFACGIDTVHWRDAELAHEMEEHQRRLALGPEQRPLGLPPMALVLRNGKRGGAPDVLPVRRSGPERTSWTTYGIIAAQRRQSGQVVVVLAGLSGPATYAAARVLTSVTAALVHGEPDSPPPVLWAVVEADVELAGTAGDGRNVTRCRIRDGFPRTWPQRSIDAPPR